MSNVTYNQAGYTYNEQYSSYTGYKNINDCTSYNQSGLTYNEISFPYAGICNITHLAQDVNLQVTIPGHDVVYSVLINPSALNLLLTNTQPDVLASQNTVISPNPFDLILSLPEKSITIDQTVLASVSILNLSSQSPNIEAIRNVYIDQAVLDIAATSQNPDVDAIQLLNISITPVMSGIDILPTSAIANISTKNIVSNVKIVANSYDTNAQIENQGYTYNQADFTYNQLNVFYGGAYGIEEKIVIKPQLKTIKPIFA